MADDIKIVGLSSKKSGGTNWKVISAIIGIIVLSVGVIAGILLVRQQQDVREKAGGNCENPASIVQCPRSDGALVSCTPPNDENNAQISLCDTAGRKEACGIGSGAREYCCPAPGGAWTLDLTACSCAAAGPTGLTVENLSPTSVKLKWTAGTGGTTTRIWVSKNTDPTGGCTTGGAANCIVNDQSVPIATTEYVVTGLTANTRYYWRLMTFAQSGCDAGTTVMNFTTTSGSNPTATATATATATGTSSATATATPTGAPNACGGTCGSNSNCGSGLYCKIASGQSSGFCRNPNCSTVSNCNCSSSSPTATSKATSTSKATAKATSSGTAFPVPETGADFPTMLGVGFGVIMVLISLALAL